MTVSSTAASGSTTGTASNVTGSTAAIANNFDQFLSLLTTQLKNQNPLDPLDTNQFTQQLVQFAGVEQQLKTNETLTALLGLGKATTTANAVGFVGATVTADGAATRLQNGTAEWRITMPRAGSVNITIKDASGNVVRTDSATLEAGTHGYSWDGRTSSGVAAPDGEYTITVDARDVSAQSMTATTEITGVVDGVDLTGSTPVLKIGAISIPLESVKTVRRASE